MSTSTTLEATPGSRLAALGESLNYQPAILDSLLNKKKSQQSFAELMQNLGKLLDPIQDADDDLDLNKMDALLASFTKESTDVQTFAAGITDGINVDMFAAVIKDLTTI